MQLRISPGGSICNSSRSRPELPPSSETVTIAESFEMRGSSVGRSLTRHFSPASKVERPVPPPIATRLKPRFSSVQKAKLCFLRGIGPVRAHAESYLKDETNETI